MCTTYTWKLPVSSWTYAQKSLAMLDATTVTTAADATEPYLVGAKAPSVYVIWMAG